jgi:hypothetical protein
MHKPSFADHPADNEDEIAFAAANGFCHTDCDIAKSIAGTP